MGRMGKHIKICSPLKPLGQMENNLVTEVLGWSSFNNVSGRSRLDQRWPSAGVYGTVKYSSSRWAIQALAKDCDTLDNAI